MPDWIKFSLCIVAGFVIVLLMLFAFWLLWVHPIVWLVVILGLLSIGIGVWIWEDFVS